MALPLEIAYGSVSFCTAILHNVFLLYHVDIFVSVYRIDKFSFWVGEGLFLVWNSLNDPLFGWLSDSKLLSLPKVASGKSYRSRDRNQTKVIDVVWSRLTALNISGPLYSLAFALFWINWTWPGIQFAVCLCLYDGFLTMVDLHHSALLADLSISGDRRTRLNSYCSIFSAIGSASVFLSYIFWNKADLSTFRFLCFSLTTVSFFGYLFMIRTLKFSYTKHVKDASSPALNSQETWDDTEHSSPSRSAGSASIGKFGRQLLSHKNFVWFALMNLVQVFHCHFNSNFFPLFLETLLGESVSSTLASTLLGISFVAPHINNLYFLSLCRKYGVYNVIRCLFILKLGLSLVMYQAGYDRTWLLCIFIASNRVFTEGICKLLSLVISDLVDEDMVIHSRPQAVSALMFGTASLVSKPGQTLAPVIGTWILSLKTGHDIFESGNESGSIKLDLTNMDSKSKADYKDGVFSILICVPVVCAVLQIVAWSMFTLKGKRLSHVKAIREGLKHVQV